MRILFHHRTLADGAEGVHIREMVNAFRQLGHEVRVLGLGTSAKAGVRRGVLQGLRRGMPASAYELASIACNASEYVNVRREIAAYRPDFLYKRHARNDVGALAAARACAVPSVLEVNCLFSAPSYRAFEPLTFVRAARAMELRALRSASVVVAVSSPLAATIDDLTGAPGSALVLPNGANPATFDPRVSDGARIRAQLGLGRELVVGWSGILREWHGLELLIAAVAAAPEAKLVIVGDGPARGRVETAIEKHGLRSRTIIVGRVPHDLMPGYIAAMDIAVVAEDRTAIASPMKLLEYMSMARAVVAPRQANIADLVAAEVTGLLFEPGNAASLTAGLARLAADLQLRAHLGRNARRLVEEQRNWLSNARTVVHLIEQRIGGVDATLSSTSGRVNHSGMIAAAFQKEHR